MSVAHAAEFRDQHIFTLSRDVGEGEVEYFLIKGSPRLFDWGLLELLERETRLRTRDPNLGKVVLYQLSYSRMRCIIHDEKIGQSFFECYRTD